MSVCRKMAILLALLFAQPAASEADRILLECERLAASPLDSERSPGVDGVLVSRIRPEAVELCRKAVQAAPAERRANFHLGRALSAAGREAEALGPYQVSANAGFALAQNNLGVILMHGAPGITPDPSSGVRWQKLAAHRGLAVAMSNVAEAYRDGRGVAKDLSTALDWARLAAGGGHKPARATAAALLESGEGIGGPRLDQAARYWRDMAVDGDLQTAEKLGRALIEGRVAPQAPQEVDTVLSRALQQGSMEAGLMLARHLSRTGADSAERARAAETAGAVYTRSRDAGPTRPEGLILHQREAALILINLEKAGALPAPVAALMPELQSGFAKSQDMARFDLRATCSGAETSVPLYVWDWNRNEPPTDLQIQWYRAVRQCVIAEDVEKSFRTIFSLARESQTSFTAMTRQAFADQPKPAPQKSRDEILNEADAVQEIWSNRSGNVYSNSEVLGVFETHVALSTRLAIQLIDHNDRVTGPLADWGKATLDARWQHIFDIAKAPGRRRGEIVDAAQAQVRRDSALAQCQLAVARSGTLDPFFEVVKKGAEVLDRELIRDALQKAILAICADPAQAGDAARITAGTLTRRLNEAAFRQRHGNVLDADYNPVGPKQLQEFQAVLIKQVEQIGGLAPIRSVVKAGRQTTNAQAGRQYLALLAREGCARDSRLCALGTMLPALDKPSSYCELVDKALARRPIRNGNLQKGNDLAFAADILTGWVMSGVNHCRWQRARLGDDLEEWRGKAILGFIAPVTELGAISDPLFGIGMMSAIEDQAIKNMQRVRRDFIYLRAQHAEIMQTLRTLP